MTDYNNENNDLRNEPAAGTDPSAAPAGGDSSYHYTGAQGSFGAAGSGSYGGNAYQAESAGGPIPEVRYSAVPPKKPKKKGRRIALVTSLICVGLVAVISLSMVAGGLLMKHFDLLGTGTLSGPTLDQAAALIELTTSGKNPVQLPNGESRTWLEDGDSIVLRGWCEKPGAARIGFGECEGTMLPARKL